MSLKCTTCGKPLEPTILKPTEELWCPLCAKYYDMEGKPTELQGSVDAIIRDELKKIPGRPPNKKPITVSIGETSFTGFDRVEFNVGQTKVVVT